MRMLWVPAWLVCFQVGLITGMEIYRPGNGTVDIMYLTTQMPFDEDLESKLFILHPVDDTAVEIDIDYISIGPVKIFTADQLLKWDKNYVTLTTAFSNKLSDSIMNALYGFSIGIGGPNGLGDYLQCYSNRLSQILACK